MPKAKIKPPDPAAPAEAATPEPEAPAAEKPHTNGVPIAGLEDIINLVAKPFPIQFAWKGKTCEIQARHLTPFESEMLKLQLDSVMPPLIRAKEEKDDRFDFYNVEFLARKTKIEREVRAQALFWCCPAFQDRLVKTAPDAIKDMHKPVARAAIVTAMQGMLVEEVLEHLYIQIRKADGSVAEKVNFV